DAAARRRREAQDSLGQLRPLLQSRRAASSPRFRAGQDQVDGGTKNTGGMSMAVETRTQSALNRFIAKTRDLFAEEPDLDKRWELLRPVLAELLADPEVTVAAEHWPDCVAKDGRAENLLFYEDPDYG